MFERVQREYEARAQPYIKWDYDGMLDDRSSYGILPIGPQMVLKNVWDDLGKCWVEKKVKVNITASQCRKALKKLLREAHVTLYLKGLTEKEIEKFREYFPDAEVVDD